MIASVIGLVIAYITVRRAHNPLAHALDQIAFIPFLFPTIAFGAMYLTLFAEPVGPIPALYGTFTLLVLISVVSRLPYSVKTGVTAITQIGQELEEAASWQGKLDHAVSPHYSAASKLWLSFRNDGELCGGHAGIVADHPAHHSFYTRPDDSWLWLCRRGACPAFQRARPDRCCPDNHWRADPDVDRQGQDGSPARKTILKGRCLKCQKSTFITSQNGTALRQR